MTDIGTCGSDHLRQAGLAAQQGQRGVAPRMLSLVAGMPPTCMMSDASALIWCNILSVAHLKTVPCMLHAWASLLRTIKGAMSSNSV